MLAPLAASLLLAALTACSPDRNESSLFAPESIGLLVVDAVLIVDQPVPEIRLTRTLAPNVPFSMAVAGVNGATISIRSGGRALVYAQVSGQPGLYQVGGGPWPPVLPGTRYDLTVTTIEGEEMSASTTTPLPFRISEWALLTDDGQTQVRTLQTFADLGDSVFYHPDNLLTVRVNH